MWCDYFGSNMILPPTTCDLSGKSMFLKPVNESSLMRMINDMKACSTVGLDGLSTSIIKLISEDIAGHLVNLINRSFSEGIFPNILKQAVVVPVFKKGDATLPDNYRQISVLGGISKVLEYVFYTQVVDFLETNDLISSSQHGFRRGRSTETATIGMFNIIYEKLDEGNIVVTLFFDLSKAFDLMCSDIAVEKFYNLGLRGVCCSWLMSYLKDRSIRVRVNGCMSEECVAALGVPQGSILGPLLFVLFMNDLPEYIQEGVTFMYADDISVVLWGSSTGEVQVKIEKVCDQVEAWCQRNRLILNEGKTVQLQFHNYRVPSNMLVNTNNREIQYLGCFLDSELRWDSHVDHVCRKLSRGYYALLQLRSSIAQDDLIGVYYSIIHTHLSYNTLLWGISTDWRRVFIAQKRIIRLLFRLHPTESCRKYFIENKILTLPSIFILKAAMYVRQNFDYFIKLGVSYSTRNGNKLLFPKHKSALYEKSPKYVSVAIYNKLPAYVTNLSTLKKFKKELKLFLFCRAFYTLQEFYST
ncbi:hypothetical protein WA026_017267 [Henosepilachna vigintioctopunctata]|uniref:Reverse transcriptase domain-containing protein n=1 Tax=Henosepilachna vigintioctopunctata TaxID=420089 RepID=A0AAW1UPI2_9CUCU